MEFDGTTMLETEFSTEDEQLENSFEEDAAAGFMYKPLSESIFNHDLVPMWQHICIIWFLFVLGSILNGIVIKVYWRIKSTCRVYVLAMAGIDLVCLTFVLLPRFVFLFWGEGLFREVVELIRHEIAMLSYSVYPSIPFFLALDRLSFSSPSRIKMWAGLA